LLWRIVRLSRKSRNRQKVRRSVSSQGHRTSKPTGPASDTIDCVRVTLAETLDRAGQARAGHFWNASENASTIVDRSQHALAYLTIGVDRQEAMTLLVGNDLRGSGAALVRPVF